MLKGKNKWLSVALINLAILALLGMVLRSKMLFSIPFVDFNNNLHAHSHFAFSGWVTLCLLTLMTYELLPEKFSSKPKYRWLFWGILINAIGMLISFFLYGYHISSITFSTLFVFVTYAYTWIFIKDLLQSQNSKAVSVLSISALFALSLSSVGPYILAYMVSTRHTDILLYKDSVYTYLHLQYNGFFTLGVFALFINHVEGSFNNVMKKRAERFAISLAISVVPTLFLSFLWHFPNNVIRSIAILGCLSLVFTLIQFIIFMRLRNDFLKTVKPFARKTGTLSMLAFSLKTIVQTGIVFPAVGKEVFGDRPIIIGYLHLVLLGFITLYLLAHLIQIGFLGNNTASKTGVVVFATAVVLNEIFLMTQGLTAMFMLGGTWYPWLLWMAAICLFTGACLMAASVMKNFRQQFA